jgi:osmoprotectant transport system ATP-binding protein
LPAVTVRSLTKYLGDSLILDKVSIEVPSGTMMAILGESGCGKTTLLRHINGLLSPDEGTIEVFGRPIDYARLPELRLRMGYAVQSVGLFPHLKVSENLSLMARLSGWSTEKVCVRRDELLRAMQLSRELLGRYPHELSGGQRQRVGMCRAMMLNPDLLLLDEPFSGVDPITRHEIHTEFLALLKNEPATTLFVTHDVREAVRLASHIVILERGRVLQQDSMQNVMDNPATESIARLFGEQFQDH